MSLHLSASPKVMVFYLIDLFILRLLFAVEWGQGWGDRDHGDEFVRTETNYSLKIQDWLQTGTLDYG